MVWTIEDEDVFLTSSNKVSKSKWIVASIASMHIFPDQVMLDLMTNGDLGRLKLGNNDKVKIEGVGSVKMNLQSCAVQIVL